MFKLAVDPTPLLILCVQGVKVTAHLPIHAKTKSTWTSTPMPRIFRVWYFSTGVIIYPFLQYILITNTANNQL
jgi:hypothetical protein